MALHAMNSPNNTSWLKTLQQKHPQQPRSEEEYLALCLIMLARSGTTTKESPPPQETQTLNNFHKCSICNKSFPSHQALGGHKASHSKPNSAAITDKQAKVVTGSAVARTHECSICHKSFPSGQALGGHKRCHYEGHIGGNSGGESQSLSQTQSRGGGGLGFDLNVLPESESDEELESQRVPRKRLRLLEEEENVDHKV